MTFLVKFLKSRQNFRMSRLGKRKVDYIPQERSVLKVEEKLILKKTRKTVVLDIDRFWRPEKALSIQSKPN